MSPGAIVDVIVVFAIGVLALSTRENVRSIGGTGTGTGTGTGQSVGASLCFPACAGAVFYGLYLIIPQFHR